jgi:hypothetical protein
MRLLTQKGFSLLMLLIILGSIGVIGLIGLFVWKTSQRTATTGQSTNTRQSSGQTDDTPSWLAKTYTSKVADFSIKYPQSWHVTGIKAGQPVSQLNGDEDQLTFQVAPDSVTLNNFKGTLTIADTAPGDEKWPLYPNGTIIKTFKNGIGLWRDNQTQYLQNGQVQNNCPSLRIANEESFGFKLKSGKYLSFIGSFCAVAGSKTAYSYGQQLTSDEFTYVSAMLQSISQ